MDHSYTDQIADSAVEEVKHTFVARAVYGLVTVLAVLQGFELHPPDAWGGAVILFGTTVAVALLEAYSDSISVMLHHGRHLSFDELREIWNDTKPVLVGAQAPTVLMVLAGIGLISVDRAIDLAQIVAFLFLFGYGWRIGGLLNEGRVRQILNGLILVFIGAIIVGIKAAFH